MPEDNSSSKSIVDKFAERQNRGRIALRSLVSAIPYVGGLLDHAIFDLSDYIRQENIEIALHELSEKIQSFDETIINKEWFEGEEAIAVMKVLLEKVSFEHEKDKIKTLGSVTAKFGLIENVDKNKPSVLDQLGSLSNSQIELVKIIHGTQQRERTIKHGALIAKASGVWYPDIITSIQNKKQYLMQTYKEDLEILESRNVIRKLLIVIPDPEHGGYVMTNLGKLVVKYLDD